MRTAIIIFIVLIIPIYLYAEWKINVTVNAEVSQERNLFALRDSVLTAANLALDNAQVKFNPSMTEGGWNVQLEVIGSKKTATDMDDFSVQIYDYFLSRFDSGQIKLEYRRKAEWKKCHQTVTAQRRS